MLNSIPIAIIVAVLTGALAGMGVGGGSLLILWLTAVLDMEPAAARSINLLFFIPAALISCIFRWHQGRLQLKRILPAIISGCAAAALMSWIGTQIDTGMLKKLFGLLLIAVGIKELFYRPRKAK